MARAKTSAPHPPRPTWQRLLFSKWGLYLGALPAGVAIIVLLVLLLRGDASQTGTDIDGTRDRVQLAIQNEVFPPGPEEIPQSAEETIGAFAFFNILRRSDNPLFAPWLSYAKIRDLIRTLAWGEQDDSFTSLGIYAGNDLEQAQAAFAALSDADGTDLIALLSPQDLDRRDVLAGFQRLPDPQIGDEALSYVITVQALPFAGGLGHTIETTVIWSRVGATILFSGRSVDVQSVGPTGLVPDPIDITALAQQLATRLAAFDPARVPPGPYEPPPPPVAAPDG